MARLALQSNQQLTVVVSALPLPLPLPAFRSEAITLVCEMAGLREPHRRKVSRLVKQSLVGTSWGGGRVSITFAHVYTRSNPLSSCAADPVLKNLNVKLTIRFACLFSLPSHCPSPIHQPRSSPLPSPPNNNPAPRAWRWW